MRPLKNILFCPIPVSDSDFNPRNTHCMSVVKIIAFLGLKQNRTFFKGLRMGNPQFSFILCMIFFVHKKRVMELETHVQIVERLNYISEIKIEKCWIKRQKLVECLADCKSLLEKRSEPRALNPVN